MHAAAENSTFCCGRNIDPVDVSGESRCERNKPQPRPPGQDGWDIHLWLHQVVSADVTYLIVMFSRYHDIGMHTCGKSFYYLPNGYP